MQTPSPQSAIELQANGLTVRLSFSLACPASPEHLSANSTDADEADALACQLEQLQQIAAAAMPRLVAAFEEAAVIVQLSYMEHSLEQLNGDVKAGAQ